MRVVFSALRAAIAEAGFHIRADAPFAIEAKHADTGAQIRAFRIAGEWRVLVFYASGFHTMDAGTPAELIGMLTAAFSADARKGVA